MTRTFDVPSNGARRALALVAATALLFTMALGSPPSTRAVTVLASDTFTRTIATPPGGWGNLDAGGSWLITNGNDLATDVNGSVGQFTHTAAGELKARAQDFNAADVDISAKFQAESPPDDAPASVTQFLIYARYDAEPDFCCYLRLVLSFNHGSASPVLRVDRQSPIGGTTVGLFQVSLPTTNNDSTVAWMLRFETAGTAVRGKAWVASGAEPGSWQIDTTDTSAGRVTGTGQDDQFVVGTFTNDFTPSMVIDVDDVLVTAASAPVDTTPPTIIARSPAANATGVGVTPTVTATFSEQVTGVSTGSFALANTANLVNLPATVSYDAGTHKASLVPSAALEVGSTYRVALSGRIKDLAGNPLAWTTWTFTVKTTFSPAAQITFKKGTLTGYQFNASGGVTALKTFTLGSNSTALATSRKTITNQSGFWLGISSGVWAGYFIRESNVAYPTAFPVTLAATPNASFSPAKSLTFKKGTHTGYQFSAGGVMTAQKTFTLGSNSAALTSARSSTITNQTGTWFLVSSGVWAGYWVRSSDVVYLTP